MLQFVLRLRNVHNSVLAESCDALRHAIGRDGSNGEGAGKEATPPSQRSDPHY